MRKFLSLFLVSLLFLSMFPTVSLANSDIDAYDEVKGLVYNNLAKEEIELLEFFQDNEKVQSTVFENYLYDINGNITLEVSDLGKFSKETGMDLETADKYINSIGKVLKIVNQKLQAIQNDRTQMIPISKNNPNHMILMSNTRCDYTKEILKSFTYESNYCKKNTEKILDNISNRSKILGGIGLAGFWNPYISITAGLGSLFTAVKYDTINRQFKNSGYTGVINRVVKVPLSPDGSYWRPLGTNWNGSNPNP